MPLRQAAALLLDYAIRIAPPESREWGQAMRGELSFVEGHWAALMWAFGGASLMAKQALMAIFIPGRGQGIPPGDELFAKNVSLGKAALVAGAGCILIALLFFGAPPFRQAFRVALKPWTFIFQMASRNLQPGFEDLANRAEAQHDPEGLAFCAVRQQNSHESVRLAEEAVRLNPNLIWVYAVVGMRHPELDEVRPWIEQLERWDPQNSLFHLIEAESIDRSHGRAPWQQRSSLRNLMIIWTVSRDSIVVSFPVTASTTRMKSRPETSSTCPTLLSRIPNGLPNPCFVPAKTLKREMTGRARSRNIGR
jgi:hypothetical protein